MANETRRRGRPASFPGVETAPLLSNIPVETRQMLRDYAAAKFDGLMNVALDTLIRQAVARSQAARKASRAARRKAQAES